MHLIGGYTLNYEQKSSYTFDITVTDSKNNKHTAEFTIDVTNVIKTISSYLEILTVQIPNGGDRFIYVGTEGNYLYVMKTEQQASIYVYDISSFALNYGANSVLV